MTNIPEEDVYHWDKLITRVSRFVASDFPHVSAEDLRQELWVFVLEHPELDFNRGGVTRRLEKLAKRTALEMRTVQLEQTCQYSYRTSDVRELLETVFDHNEWDGAWVPADARSDDPMDSVEVRADVAWAMNGLPDNYKSVIIARYQLGIEPPVGSSQRRTLNRAIQRLAQLMNTYYSQRPRRRAITNAQAAYIIEEQTG